MGGNEYLVQNNLLVNFGSLLITKTDMTRDYRKPCRGAVTSGGELPVVVHLFAVSAANAQHQNLK